jgi:hypothetical protein
MMRSRPRKQGCCVLMRAFSPRLFITVFADSAREIMAECEAELEKTDFEDIITYQDRTCSVRTPLTRPRRLLCRPLLKRMTSSQ